MFLLLLKNFDITLPSLVYNTNNTRGHNYKISKAYCSTLQRIYYLVYRIPNIWNSFSDDIVNIFKNKLKFKKKTRFNKNLIIIYIYYYIHFNFSIYIFYLVILFMTSIYLRRKKAFIYVYVISNDNNNNNSAHQCLFLLLLWFDHFKKYQSLCVLSVYTSVSKWRLPVRHHYAIKFVANRFKNMNHESFLDVGSKPYGVIWQRKHAPNKDDGTMLHIAHVSESYVTTQKKHVRFLQIALDGGGERLVAADHQGNIYLFDFEKNRYHLICSCGNSPTSLTWNEYRLNEVLVALTNYEVRCYNVVTKECMSILKGHTSVVHSISVHSSGRYALSSTLDTTMLWDLNTFTKKRTLNGAQDVGIQKVFFLRNSNKIISCFKDDSVFVWNCETMKCLYQLSVPIDKKLAIKCLTPSYDGRVLVAGGKSKFLYFWNLDSRQLIQVIELPDKVKEVKHIEFITDKLSISQNQILAVLSQDGIIRFIEPHTCVLKAEVGGNEKRIHSFSVSQNTHHLATILDNGNISLHYIGNIIHPKGKEVAVQKVSSIPNKQDKIKSNKLKQGQKKKGQSKIENISTEDNSKESLYRALPEGLNMKRLKFILTGHGEYPSKYRLFIWRSILQLPENHSSFSSLVDKGTHISYACIQETFPIKSRKLLRVLQRVLSALAYWSPIFGETDYLPMMVFPIIKIFPNNQLICFEIVATILQNWCQKWFEFFPNPPISILAIIEKLLAHHDAALLNHFVKMELSTVSYAWPLMSTLFSEIFTKDEWLIVWDHVFTNEPSFMLCFVVAYVINARRSLLATTCIDDFEYFFHHRNPIDLSATIKEAYKIYSSSPSDCNPKEMLDSFQPLTKDQYPVMNSYPKFVVNYLIEERERIKLEELEYLKQKQVALSMKQERNKLHHEELAFYRDQEMMLKAEEERRVLIKREEEKLVAQRKKLHSLRKDMALTDLENCDEVRRKFLQHQRLLNGMQLQRLDDQLEKKIRQREEEKSDAINDVEINGLEVEVHKRKLEEGLLRNDVTQTLASDNFMQTLRHHLPDRREYKKHQLLTCSDTQSQPQLDLSTFNELRHQRPMKELEDLERDIQLLQDETLQPDGDLSSTSATINNETFSSMTSSNTVLSQRGSFNNKQLDLMSQVRDLRLQMAHKHRKAT